MICNLIELSCNMWINGCWLFKVARAATCLTIITIWVLFYRKPWSPNFTDVTRSQRPWSSLPWTESLTSLTWLEISLRYAQHFSNTQKLFSSHSLNIVRSLDDQDFHRLICFCSNTAFLPSKASIPTWRLSQHKQ